MKKTVYVSLVWLLFFYSPVLNAQQDSSVNIGKKIVTLKEIVIRNGLNVGGFIERVKNDTTFYKAFKNLKILGYTALNDIRVHDKLGNQTASLESKTTQLVNNGCRTTQTLEERITGDIYDENKNWNYYTGELYAGLLFAKGTVCGETNIVKGYDLSIKDKKGIDKHKEQLKMLFFNPGKKIPGIPFIGDKIAIFDDAVSPLYDFIIDMAEYQGQLCYVFTIKARTDLSNSQKNDIVINQMVTWFNSKSLEIVARTYDISYDAAIYDFNVQMEVQMEKYDDLLVPKLIRYSGNWHALFKKRERAVFTATLFDFNTGGK
ncbi:MAG TPA: hypothetical protein VKI61_02075 [Chitinophagaceae bacterium]|jgi:hypothetical protein|nr:hypothetical protein [Chitinophagaceae bacterium]